MKIDGNIDRLPIWAQNKIRHLEQVVASQQDRIAALSEGPPDSNTFADPFNDVARALGKNTLVRFGSRGYDGPSFDVRLMDGELEVRTSSMHNEETVILPRVSNAFTVGFRPRS